MASFANEPVDVGSLPSLSDDDFVAVDSNLLRVALLAMAAFALVVVGVAGVLSFLLSRGTADTVWVPFIVAAVLVAMTAIAAVLRVIEIRHIGYQVRTHDISYRSGVLVRRVSTVPYRRVQHARIRQGPVQRRFSISTLEVNSAGPDLRIHGLPSVTAERLKAMVVERAGDLQDIPSVPSE